jgi:signal transduction histidine kinase
MLTVQDHLARFFYTMSAHQYITPLNSIIGASHLLIEEGKTSREPGQMELLNIIYASGNKLYRISKKMHWFFMLRFHQRSPWVEEPMAEVPIMEMLQSFLETLEVEDKQWFTWDIRVNPDLRCYCNELLLRFMMGELLENAFRHGDKKQPITVTVTADDAGAFHMTVTNAYESGTQFDETRIEPFCNASVSQQGMISGTGLGLFLLKDWAESLGGKLQVDGKEHAFNAGLYIPGPQKAF